MTERRLGDVGLDPQDANERGRTASNCAKLGLAVFPVSDNKVPTIKRWQEDATRDQSQILDWWGGSHRGHAVGVATGRLSGVWVLDVDPGHGGWESLEKLEVRHGQKLPRTWRVGTPSGGAHFYFRYPDGLDVVTDRDTFGPDLPGLDTRGRGGMVMAPGVRLVGRGEYCPAFSEVEFAETPAWLLSLVERTTGRLGGLAAGLTAGGVSVGDGRPEDFEVWVEGAAAVGAGGQEAYLADGVFRMRKADVSERDMLSLGWRCAQNFVAEPGREPWSIGDVTRKVNSTVEKIIPDPKVSPEQRAWADNVRNLSDHVAAGTGAPVAAPGTENPAGGTVLPFPQSDGESGGSGGGPGSGNNGGNGSGGGGRGRDELYGYDPLLRWSEHGAVLRYVELNSALHKYNPETGWYAWNGAFWEADKEGAKAETVAIDRLLAWYAVEAAAHPGRAEEEQRIVAGFLSKIENVRTQKALVAAARNRAAIRVEDVNDWNPDPWLLTVQNGTLDLRTSELREFRPEDLCTMQTGAAYDPEALCPLWTDFIDWFTAGKDGTPDATESDKFQLFAGYSLTGSVRENKALMMVGSGQNGKSVLTETLARILGGYADKADPKIFVGKDSDHSTELTDLLGKRFVYGSELPENGLNVDRFKFLTGESEMKARKMHKDLMKFRVQAKFWTHGNALPRTPLAAGRSDGYWRRLVALDCKQQVSEEDKDDTLKDKFWEERDGILAWMVRGCLEWQIRKIPETWRGRQLIAAYRNEENPVTPFAESFFVDPSEVSERIWVPFPVLQHYWEAYCREAGERALPVRELAKQLRLLEGFGTETDKHPQQVYLGDGVERRKSCRGLTCPLFQDGHDYNWRYV